MKPIEGLEFDVPVEEKLTRQDKRLGLPAGTTKAQLTVESNMKADAVSKAGAEGWAQVMPKTRATLEKRVGRPLDPTNLDDALLMHGEVMRENLAKFKTPQAAMKAYNGGWSPEKWNNPETAAYVPKIEAERARIQKVAMAKPIDGLIFEPSPAVAPIALDTEAPAKIRVTPEAKPNIGRAGQFVAGVGRGLEDAVDGGAFLVDKGLRSLGVDTTAINNGANSLLAKILPTALADLIIAPGSVSDVNKSNEAAYKNKVGDSGLATAGRIGGNIGSVFVPGTGQAQALKLASNLWKAPGVANKIGSVGVASGLGAAQGSVLNTKTDQDNALANATGGAAAGVVGQAALPLIKAGVKGAGAIIEPFTNRGVGLMARDGVEKFASGPIDPKFTSNVPGFKPTLAQATQDPGLAQLTRAIQSASPDAATALSLRAQGNNSALIDAIRGVAGDDAAKAATETARRQATAPLYAAVDKNLAVPDLTPIQSLLSGLSNRHQGRPAVQGPLQDVASTIPENATVGQLSNVVKTISDKMNLKAADGSPANAAAMRELGVIKRKTEQVIGRESPEYQAAQKLFSELSKPMNSQLIAEQMLKKATGGSVDPVTGNPQLFAASFGNLFKDGGEGLVKNATGRKTLGGIEGNVTPEAMQQFNSVKQALDLIAGAEKAGAVSGSRTAQLGAGQNILQNALGPLGLASMSGAPQMGLAHRVLDKIYKSQDPLINKKISDILLDPAMLASLPQRRTGSPILNEAMQRAISGGGAIAGGSASQQ